MRPITDTKDRSLYTSDSIRVVVGKEHLPKLEQEVKRLRELAYRCHVPQPEIIVHETTTKTVTDPDTEMTKTITEVSVEITNAFPRLQDWRFVAAIDHMPNGMNVVRFSPMFREMEGTEDLWTAPPKCDHCGHNRHRNKTYIWEHEADRTRMTVGSTCLKDFSGHSPSLSFLYAVERLLLDEERMAGFGGSATHTAKDILGVAAFIIKNLGYQRSDSETATKRVIPLILNLRTFADTRYDRWERLTNEDNLELENAVQWVLDQEPTTDYMRNLKVIFTANSGDDRWHGFIASLLPTYRKALNLIKERELNTPENRVPVVTGEAVDVEGAIISTDIKHNHYDGSTRYVMTVLDDRGFKVWGTQPAKISNAVVGDRVKFIAEISVSDRDEYFGFYKRPRKVAHITTA